MPSPNHLSVNKWVRRVTCTCNALHNNANQRAYHFLSTHTEGPRYCTNIVTYNGACTLNKVRQGWLSSYLSTILVCFDTVCLCEVGTYHRNYLDCSKVLSRHELFVFLIYHWGIELSRKCLFVISCAQMFFDSSGAASYRPPDNNESETSK